jgi:outer membrane protein assembly factor BamD
VPQSKWAAQASLMVGYADYSRSAYLSAIFSLERHIINYPADKNLPYVHYLIAICYYEQILDEKKDLQPLLKAKKKFEFIIQTYPNTDYAIDGRFKIDLITDQLAAKEMSIARFYMKTKKWIPALNRLKTVVEKYEKTVFIEEALHRLVEVYYRLGLIDEAKKAATILGYNYQSGDWYKRSYQVFNKKYKSKKINEKKKMGLIRKKIKGLFE